MKIKFIFKIFIIYFVFISKKINLIINDLISEPYIGKKSNKHDKTNIRFFNHAFLKISGHNFSFCIDPWAIGPAFHTGWWLKNKTKSLELSLSSCIRTFF